MDQSCHWNSSPHARCLQTHRLEANKTSEKEPQRGSVKQRTGWSNGPTLVTTANHQHLPQRGSVKRTNAPSTHPEKAPPQKGQGRQPTAELQDDSKAAQRQTSAAAAPPEPSASNRDAFVEARKTPPPRNSPSKAPKTPREAPPKYPPQAPGSKPPPPDPRREPPSREDHETGPPGSTGPKPKPRLEAPQRRKNETH